MAFTRLFDSWRPSDKKKVPQTLLLADDSVTIQRVIELTFADEDITVVAVSDGDQAIERIEADPPDIVLVDIGMPGRTGYEVAQHIKQSPRLSRIPVLLLTGAFEPIDHEKATAVGCDGVLAKPFEPQMVIARVNELLGRSAAEQPRTGRPDAPPKPTPPPVRSDIWGAPPAADAPDPGRVADKVARLDSYFDQLDEAFATLGAQPSSAPAPRAELSSSPAAGMVDWYGPGSSAVANPSDVSNPSATPNPSAALNSLDALDSLDAPGPWAATSPTAAANALVETNPDERSTGSAAAFATPIMPDGGVDAEGPAERVEASAPAAPPIGAAAAAAVPPLADAFAAILAAERHNGEPALPAAWRPASSAPSPLSDDVIEEVTRRVLERLSSQAVRDAVTDLVSGIAERLVREEIERIKASVT
jgi:CheY-like chemotaxis protein